MKSEDFRKYSDTLASLMYDFHRLRPTNILSELSDSEFKFLLFLAYGENFPGNCDTKKETCHPYGALPDKVESKKVSDAKNLMKMPAPAISRMMRNLEKRNLISRKTDAGDRRNTLVEITAAGIKTLEGSMEEFHAFMLRVLQGVGEEKINELTNLLADFLRVVKKETERIKESKGNRKNQGAKS